MQLYMTTRDVAQRRSGDGRTFSWLSRLLSRKLLALAGALIIACSMAESAAAKPNIVLIVTDDMEVGLVAHMPVLKRLIIDQGATFERAYFNYPLCCPSRANLLTGKYTQNTKVTGQSHAQFFNNGNPDHTFAVWLTAAGRAVSDTAEETKQGL